MIREELLSLPLPLIDAPDRDPFVQLVHNTAFADLANAFRDPETEEALPSLMSQSERVALFEYLPDDERVERGGHPQAGLKDTSITRSSVHPTHPALQSC